MKIQILSALAELGRELRLLYFGNFYCRNKEPYFEQKSERLSKSA